MKKHCIYFFFWAAITSFSSGNQQDLKLLEEKLNKAVGQIEMNILSGELASLWEKELVKVEKDISANLDGEGLEFFMKASQGWRVFREHHALYEGHFSAGGSIQPFVVNMNYINITKKRINQLSQKTEW